MLIGALAAIQMTVFMDLTDPRKGGRLQVSLDVSALPEIDKFVRDHAARLRWNPASAERLSSAAEETLLSLLQAGEDRPGGDAPRPIVITRPDAGQVEMEFLAVFDEENLEDRLAYLSEETEGVEEG